MPTGGSASLVLKEFAKGYPRIKNIRLREDIFSYTDWPEGIDWDDIASKLRKIEDVSHCEALLSHVQFSFLPVPTLKILQINDPLNSSNDRLDSSGRTALHYAALSGNLTLVQPLLDKGFNLNAKDRAGRTPLHYAALSGKHEVILLLEKKVQQLNGDEACKNPMRDKQE